MLTSYFMAPVGSIQGPPVTIYLNKLANFSVLSSFQPSSVVGKVRIGVTGGYIKEMPDELNRLG